jgi:hypothetical protein
MSSNKKKRNSSFYPMLAEGEKAEALDIPLQHSRSQLHSVLVEHLFVDHHGQQVQPQ